MTGLSAQTMFSSAEVEYRTARARAQYPRSHRPHRVRRRRTLHLPHPRPRPLTLA